MVPQPVAGDHRGGHDHDRGGRQAGASGRVDAMRQGQRGPRDESLACIERSLSAAETRPGTSSASRKELATCRKEPVCKAVGVDSPRFGTLAVHDSGELAPSRPLTPALVRSSAFLPGGGWSYSRLGNPTVTGLEGRLAGLDRAERSLACSSGSATLTCSLLTLVPLGGRVVAASQICADSAHVLVDEMGRLGRGVVFCDLDDMGAWQRELAHPLATVAFAEAIAESVASRGRHPGAGPGGRGLRGRSGDRRHRRYACQPVAAGARRRPGAALCRQVPERPLRPGRRRRLGRRATIESIRATVPTTRLPDQPRCRGAAAARAADAGRAHAAPQPERPGRGRAAGRAPAGAVGRLPAAGRLARHRAGRVPTACRGLRGAVGFEPVGGAARVRALAAGLRTIEPAPTFGGVRVADRAGRAGAAVARTASPAGSFRLSVGLEHVDDLLDDLDRGLATSGEIARIGVVDAV